MEEQGIANAAFLRTEIENIDRFFGPEEVDEIWITFPDPQMQKDPQAADVYALPSDVRTFPEEGGVVNLKTDSPFLFEYTKRVAELNGFEILSITDDLYGSGMADPVSSIKTYYESQWLSRGRR